MRDQRIDESQFPSRNRRYSVDPPSSQRRRAEPHSISDHFHERGSADKELCATEEEEVRSFSSDSSRPDTELQDISRRVRKENEEAITHKGGDVDEHNKYNEHYDDDDNEHKDDDEDDDKNGGGDNKLKKGTNDDDYRECSSQGGDTGGDKDQGRRRMSILDRLIEYQSERL